MTGVSPALAEWSVAAGSPTRVLLNPGLPFGQRLLFTVVFAGVAGGGWLVLAVKLRAADGEAQTDREVNSNLERTDLKAGGDPATTLEAFLKYCWPYIEAFYEQRQPDPDERDPDAIRFQGFSVDSMLFTTLIVGHRGPLWRPVPSGPIEGQKIRRETDSPPLADTNAFGSGVSTVGRGTTRS